MDTVAYLGLGIMGGSMAANMARAGITVRGWNRTAARPSVQVAAEGAAQIFADKLEAVFGADFIFLCLSDVEDLEQVLFGAHGIAAHLKTGTVVVDMSTTGPQCAKDVHSRLKELSIDFLDAPVSGGDIGARNGTLTIMVGGEIGVFQRCLPIFESIGKNIRHCGGPGAGQAVKLCNQVLCAVNMVAVCEAFRIAQDMGIDENLIVDVCGTGAAGSWALSNLGPRILRKEFGPGFMIDHMLKDLRLVREAVGTENDATPGTTLAQERFREIKEKVSAGGQLGTHAMMLTYVQE